MIKKTPKQQITEKSEDPTIVPVATPDTAVPSSSPEPKEESVMATRPTPPTPLTPTPPTPVSPPSKPAQVVILKKVGERNADPSSDRNLERSSDRRFERRPVPPPTKAPAPISQCGNYKAGDEIVLPYSGQTVVLTYFYQSANSEDFWGAFEGGCVRVSALP